MLLPAIEDKSILRPGSDRHYIPNKEYSEFWDVFYAFLRKNFKFQEPIKDIKGRINPYFGNFGLCYQPINQTFGYFNMGIDITARAKTSVFSIFPGLLEYSGFGHINGNYVFLSHPSIKTEDGFVLHSLYMHLRSFNVKFSSYQKMLRKISFNKYPNVDVLGGVKIGEVGSTGNVYGIHTNLHLQIEFRNDAGKIIVINPSELLGIPFEENITKDLVRIEEFKKIGLENLNDIKKLGIDKYWKI